MIADKFREYVMCHTNISGFYITDEVTDLIEAVERHVNSAQRVDSKVRGAFTALREKIEEL